jgi:hypothetical protein
LSPKASGLHLQSTCFWVKWSYTHSVKVLQLLRKIIKELQNNSPAQLRENIDEMHDQSDFIFLKIVSRLAGSGAMLYLAAFTSTNIHKYVSNIFVTITGA